MSEARIWRRSDGTATLEWPEGVRTIECTRDMIQSFVDDLNKRRDLIEAFLLLDGTFPTEEDWVEAWRITCDRAREVLGVLVS